MSLEAILMVGRICTGLSILVVLADIDRRTYLVPNGIVAGGAVLGLAWHAASGFINAGEACMAGLCAFLLMLLFRNVGSALFGRHGFGLGDVKMSFMLGCIFGWHSLMILYVAICIAAIIGVSGRLTRRFASLNRLPFLPFVCAAAWLYSLTLFMGVEI